MCIFYFHIFQSDSDGHTRLDVLEIVGIYEREKEIQTISEVNYFREKNTKLKHFGRTEIHINIFYSIHRKWINIEQGLGEERQEVKKALEYRKV